MNYSTSIRLSLSAILLGATFSVAAEDLEAALNAQKKKAKRHVYSHAALIDNRNIVIPKTVSEEERALDRDLERLEKQLTQQGPAPQSIVAPRTFSRTPEPVKNWLTPTLLDAENDDVLSPETNEEGWISRELGRQKELQQHEKELAEEEALVNKLLQEEMRNRAAPQKSLLPTYESPFQPQITPQITPLSLGYNSVNPLGEVPSKSSERAPTSLSSPAARANSGIIKPSFSSSLTPISASSSRSSSGRSQAGSSVKRSPTDFSSDWKGSIKKPLSPLKRVRQASPIHRKDPFAEDFMLEIKTSIWD